MSGMARGKKLTFVAAAIAAAVLVVGLGAAGAIAASRILSPSDESKAVIDDAAAQLGVKPKALSDALKQALKNRIDAAVAAGVLTKDQAQELKDRVDSGEYPMLFGLHGIEGHGFGFAHDFGARGFGHHGPFVIVETAASYLGMTETELREALHDKTLAEIAKDKGKSVSGLVAALVAAEEKTLDQAVADGRITKAHATAIKSKLDERMQALVNGELRTPADGPHPGFWPGSGSPRGPPPVFGGPRA